MVARYTAAALALSLVALTGLACEDGAVGPERPANSVIAVTTGTDHSCAIRKDAALYCWGSDASSELGTRARGSSARPVRADATAPFVKVSAGAHHTCALDAAGQVYCWGNNTFGQLGNGGTVTLDVPVVMTVPERFTSVASGARHSCALTAGGEPWCWGTGGQGQLGHGLFRSELRPVRLSSSVRFAALSGGAAHTCGLALDGKAYCWGDNRSGQLGTGTLDNAAAPVAVAGDQVYQTISAGVSHTCAIRADQVAFCWGSSEFGEIGNTTVSRPGEPASLRPVRIFGEWTWRRIEAGAGFTCGITSTGAGFCWGRGLEGQLGGGQIRNAATPQQVTTGAAFFDSVFSLAELDLGQTHACALTASGALYCWGRGDAGQLGNQVTTFTALAMRVAFE